MIRALQNGVEHKKLLWSNSQIKLVIDVALTVSAAV